VLPLFDRCCDRTVDRSRTPQLPRVCRIRCSLPLIDVYRYRCVTRAVAFYVTLHVAVVAIYVFVVVDVPRRVCRVRVYVLPFCARSFTSFCTVMLIDRSLISCSVPYSAALPRCVRALPPLPLRYALIVTHYPLLPLQISQLPFWLPRACRCRIPPF